MVKEEKNELVELRKRFDVVYVLCSGLVRERDALRDAVNKRKAAANTAQLLEDEDEGKWSWLVQVVAIVLLSFIAGRSTSDISLNFFLRDY